MTPGKNVIDTQDSRIDKQTRGIVAIVVGSRNLQGITIGSVSITMAQGGVFRVVVFYLAAKVLSSYDERRKKLTTSQMMHKRQSLYPFLLQHPLRMPSPRAYSSNIATPNSGLAHTAVLPLDHDTVVP